MKLLFPSGLATELEVAGARTQTLPTGHRPEGKLVTSWRTIARHLRMQAEQITKQDIAAQQLARGEAYGHVPSDAKDLLARANTYELCASELAVALGIRG
jgi:hypothetical protein